MKLLWAGHVKRMGEIRNANKIVSEIRREEITYGGLGVVSIVLNTAVKQGLMLWSRHICLRMEFGNGVL
jgi:hypothetical protein